MKINIPDNAKYIIDTLAANGYEAYVVGGCVRDALLDIEPKDWDITTNALPSQVKELFKRTVDTGIKHGTVTVLIGKEGYEVTTYRVDGEYKDGRHPENVEFTRNLIEDLKRRDFTINAMAYNDATGLVDNFDGLNDLKQGIIRCVGNPKDRFGEDALRMMRAVRFGAQLGFTIEDNTAQTIRNLASNIELISAERIREELTKTLMSKNPGMVFKFLDYALSPIILPKLKEHVTCGRRKLITDILCNSQAKLYIRYALLYSYSGEKDVRKALRELRFDNKTVDTVTKIVKYLHTDFALDEIYVRHMLNICKKDVFLLLIEAKYILEKGLDMPCEYICDIENMTHMILDRGDAYEMSMLAISGNDLIEMGVERGVKVGEILAKLLDDVIKNPLDNDEIILKTKVNEMYQS